MRRLLSATAVLCLAPWLAQAEEAAFVLGTGDYATLDDLPRGSESVEAIDGLANAGFGVAALENGSADRVARWLRDLVAAAPESDRLLVVLTGRFVTDGTRTWYLTRDAREPSLLGLDETAVSVESLLRVLATAPSRAVLLLGANPDLDGAYDPFLREGIGRIVPPEGVTVLRGNLRNVANFMADGLAVRGQGLLALLERTPEISVTGEPPRDFALVPGRAGSAAEEAALWQGAVALDTVEAYRRYLEAYPQGRYAGQARDAIATIRAEPNRDARVAEDALDLTRDQRREIQRSLTLLDLDPKGIDGIFGAGTRRAITDWQQQNGFPQTSYLDREQIERLSAQAARRSQQIEAEAERTRAAAERADNAYWEETGAQGDEAGLRAYVARYPDGVHADDAQALLRRIEADKRQVAQGQERAAWDRAQAADTVASYQSYLEDFPEGAFRDEATARRDELRRAGQAGAADAQAQAQERALGLNALTARVIEQRLDVLRLNPGKVDGQFDGDTRRALRNYQRDRGLPATGYLNEQTLVRLLADTLGRALPQ